MNPRERILAMGLLGVLVLVGGYFALVKPFYLDALRDRDANIARLKKDIRERYDRMAQIQRDMPKLQRWRQLSLPSVPSDPDLPRREYEKYLYGLLLDSGFVATGVRVAAESPDVNSSPKLGLGTKKEPIYTLLPFKIVAHGDLSNLVEMMERFYRTGMLHRIKTLAIRRPLTTTGPQQRTGELDFEMTVEAVIINGANNRSYLLPNISRSLLTLDVVTGLWGGVGQVGLATPSPPGLTLVPWAVWAAGPTGVQGPRILAQQTRQYASIAAKNIFTAPAPVFVRERQDAEVTQFVKLNSISRDERRSEACLYDVYNNRNTRLRAEAGFNRFRVMDNEGETVVGGTVIRIDERDLIFRVEENYYSIHVGQSLQDALDPKNRLSAERLKELGIAAAPSDKVSSGQ